MAKRSRMWRRWFGVVSVGVTVLMGANGGAWGQGATPDVAALEEAERLNDEALRLRGC